MIKVSHLKLLNSDTFICGFTLVQLHTKDCVEQPHHSPDVFVKLTASPLVLIFICPCSSGSARQRWRNWLRWTPWPCCKYLHLSAPTLYTVASTLILSLFRSLHLEPPLQYLDFPDGLYNSSV